MLRRPPQLGFLGFFRTLMEAGMINVINGGGHFHRSY